jgi:hypothetical protein
MQSYYTLQVSTQSSRVQVCGQNHAIVCAWQKQSPNPQYDFNANTIFNKALSWNDKYRIKRK